MREGTPVWVDLATSDVEAARSFYGALFGWTADAGEDGYAMFRMDGKAVAGLTALAFENQPVWWSTYFAADDAEAVTARIQAAGAEVHIEPTAVGDTGRVAFFRHPAAGAFGIWEPGTHAGTELTNAPVSLVWNQLLTSDVPAATAFLVGVFGMTASGDELMVLSLDERPVAGLMERPDGGESWWNIAFAVDEVDATVARAVSLGGAVTLPAMDVEGVGRIAGLRDPQGGQFSVAAV